MLSRRCVVHYRKLARENDQFPDCTLSEALSRALAHDHVDGKCVADNWQFRLTPVPKLNDHYRFLNDFHDDGKSIFGNLCLFSPSQLQALIERSPNAEAVDIFEKKAPNGTDYLHGIAYWLAISDHLFVVQHTSIQVKAMEEYFTWFLRDQTPVIQGSHRVELQAVFDRNLVGGDLDDITSVEVGGLIPETVPAEESDARRIETGRGKLIEYESKETIGDRMAKTFSKARKILEAAIGSMETQEIIDAIPDEAALEVIVNIGYRARRRKFSKEFMSNIASGLRNLPDGELRIRSKGGTIVGDDARLQTVMPIKRVRENSMLLDNEDARRQLREVYRRFLEDARIID